jgi:hypothetical protein
MNCSANWAARRFHFSEPASKRKSVAEAASAARSFWRVNIISVSPLKHLEFEQFTSRNDLILPDLNSMGCWSARLTFGADYLVRMRLTETKFLTKSRPRRGIVAVA